MTMKRYTSKETLISITLATAISFLIKYKGALPIATQKQNETKQVNLNSYLR
jgi:hypothetical protein